jgi:hypothetical protein
MPRSRGKLNTEFMLLAIFNKPRLTLDEVCCALGISTGTGYQQRCRGVFPVPMIGSPLSADVRDVAIALDKLREQAKLSASLVHQ